MMSRSQTGLQSTLTRKAGVTLSFTEVPPSVVYDHISLPTASLCAVKFRFSGSAEYDTGLHFHAEKGEALRVETGAILVQIGQDTLRVTPETGEVTIPRWVVHRWWLPADENGETIVWERTLPGSREKEAFFRTLISYIGDLPPNTPPTFFQLYTIFARWDNFPVLGTWCARGPGARLVVIWTHILGAIGRALGYQPGYVEYLPEEIHSLLGL
ncbi:hypothetical protein FIBSPDRAFT_925715 [Athelia psychrophila]|uniref:Cupin 2 conserved barrel domain-containing protein n=1 Tax=Athelia psychrophila TaxID=1759441 RepID=A0A166U946_9AGAM|nr:hypothetical protein FIBSPDRAFT_925715 [Fibularhizoctonia sp. CBS 109695]